jgi:hypothetical protein
MPRYYFNFRGSGANDLEGENFPDDAAAIAEAKIAARELRQGRKKGSLERIVVTNAQGETIHEQAVDE